MVKSIKIEFYKATHNKYFVVAMILAFIVQMFNFTANLEYYNFAMRETPGFGYPSHEDTFSIMVFWLSHEDFSMGATLASYMLPILAVLPYGWSFIGEILSGYQNNMLCRMSRRQYFISKYIAAFVTGGLVPAFMLITNLFMNSFIAVLRSPYPYTLTTSVYRGTFASKLYYTNPILFILIWTAIAFLWGGVYAGLTLFWAQFIKKSVIILSAPFLLALIVDSFCHVFFKAGSLSFMSNYFVSTASRNENWIIFAELFLLFSVGFFGGLVFYEKKEAL